MTRCGGSASTPGRIGDSAAHQAGASPSHVGTRQSGPRPIILPPGPCRCHSGAMPPAPLLSFAGHAFVPLAGRALFRSEEHTSDLQSLMRNPYAVFRLKKKTPIAPTANHLRHATANTK